MNLSFLFFLPDMFWRCDWHVVGVLGGEGKGTKKKKEKKNTQFKLNYTNFNFLVK